jgi:hypothetical protein
MVASELRAVLMFHSVLSRIEWHPTQPELLLMRCEGEPYNSIVFVWDPVSDGPQPIDFSALLSGGMMSGRPTSVWLKTNVEPASLFFADSKACLICSLAETDEEILPWRTAQSAASINQDRSAESPLDFMPNTGGEGDSHGSDISELDDTFRFKNFGG